MKKFTSWGRHAASRRQFNSAAAPCANLRIIQASALLLTDAAAVGYATGCVFVTVDPQRFSKLWSSKFLCGVTSRGAMNNVTPPRVLGCSSSSGFCVPARLTISIVLSDALQLLNLACQVRNRAGPRNDAVDISEK